MNDVASMQIHGSNQVANSNDNLQQISNSIQGSSAKSNVNEKSPSTNVVANGAQKTASVSGSQAQTQSISQTFGASSQPQASNLQEALKNQGVTLTSSLGGSNGAGHLIGVSGAHNNNQGASAGSFGQISAGASGAQNAFAPQTVGNSAGQQVSQQTSIGGGAGQSIQGAGGVASSQITYGPHGSNAHGARKVAGNHGGSQGIAKDSANVASDQVQSQAPSDKKVSSQLILNNNAIAQQLAPSGVLQQQISLQTQQAVADQKQKIQAQPLQMQKQKAIRSKSSDDLHNYLEENHSESSGSDAGAAQERTFQNYQQDRVSNYQGASRWPPEVRFNMPAGFGQGQNKLLPGGQQASSDRSESSYSYSDSLNSSKYQHRSSNMIYNHYKDDESGGFRSSNFHTTHDGGGIAYANGASKKKTHDLLMFELDGSESEQAASRGLDSRNFGSRAFTNHGDRTSLFGRGSGDESDEYSPQPDMNSPQRYEHKPSKPVLDQFSQQESMGDDDAELIEQQEEPKAHAIVLPLKPDDAFPTITLKVCTAPDGMPGSQCTKELRLLVDPSSVGIRVFNHAIESLGLEHAPAFRNDKGRASLATCSRVRGAALWGPVVQAYVKAGDHWTQQKIALQQIGQGYLGQAPKACQVTPQSLQTFALRKKIDGIIGIGPFRHEPEQGDDGTARYYSCHGNSCTQAPGTVEQQRLANLAGALVPPENHVAASVLHMPGMGNGENQRGMLSLSVTAELRKTLKDTDLSVDFAPNHSVEQQLKAALQQHDAGDGKSTWEGDSGIDLSRLSGRSLSIFLEDDDPAGEHGLFPAAYCVQ